MEDGWDDMQVGGRRVCRREIAMRVALKNVKTLVDKIGSSR